MEKLMFVYNPENWDSQSLVDLEERFAVAGFSFDKIERADEAYGLLQEKAGDYAGVYLGDLRLSSGCLKNMSELEAGLLVENEAKSLRMKTSAMVFSNRGLARTLREKGVEIIVLPANIDEYVPRLVEFFSGVKEQEPDANCGS